MKFCAKQKYRHRHKRTNIWTLCWGRGKWNGLGNQDWYKYTTDAIIKVEN